MSWNANIPQTNPVANSATAAAGNAIATLPAVANKTLFIEGFTVTGTGATAASIVNVAVTGFNTAIGTLSYAVLAPAGVNTAITTLDIRFPTPLPASAANTAIVVNVPNFGSGNTNVAVVAYGFYAANQ